MAHRLPRPISPRHGSAGFTLVELAVASSLLLLAASMVASTVLASSRQRVANRERAVAGNAISVVFEQMRNEALEDVVVLYNADPFDDPGGPGTAPGSAFAVDELPPLELEQETAMAEILLPVVNTGDPIAPVWEVREDADIPELGMPRELNGDGVVDDQDHSNDYRVLPAAVTVRWRSRMGPREFRMHTLLLDWRAAQ